MTKVKIVLDREDPTEGLHFVVLDSGTQRYMNVKISSAKDHVKIGIERNYRGHLKNSYFLFRHDIINTWNLAKKTKKFRKYPESFKDISLIWNNLPKNIIEIYEQIYMDYRELIPKFEEFVQYSPEKNIDGENFEEFINYSNFRSEELQHITPVNCDNLPATINPVGKSEVVNCDNLPATINSVEKSEIVNYDNLPATINSVEKNQVVSDLDHTSTMQYNLHDLNSEIELEIYLNSLSNAENDIMREFTYF